MRLVQCSQGVSLIGGAEAATTEAAADMVVAEADSLSIENIQNLIYFILLLLF